MIGTCGGATVTSLGEMIRCQRETLSEIEAISHTIRDLCDGPLFDTSLGTDAEAFLLCIESDIHNRLRQLRRDENELWRRLGYCAGSGRNETAGG